MYGQISMTRMWPALLLGLATAAGTQAALAGDDDDDDEDEVPFEEASLFFELNDTDGDLGIHGLIDGDAWKKLEIEDPRGRELMEVRIRSRLRRQGLTEIFFESAEPTFDELAPEEFFRRFPAGEYEISGETIEGEELESVVEVSQVLAARAEQIALNGVPAAESCDDDPLPAVSAPVLVSWDPVTTSHPEIGETGPIEVEKYQFVVEREEPSLLILSVDLPADVTEFEIPEGFLDLGDEFKFEIIVRASNGNQTAIESCFELE